MELKIDGYLNSACPKKTSSCTSLLLVMWSLPQEIPAASTQFFKPEIHGQVRIAFPSHSLVIRRPLSGFLDSTPSYFSICLLLSSCLVMLSYLTLDTSLAWSIKWDRSNPLKIVLSLRSFPWILGWWWWWWLTPLDTIIKMTLNHE